MLASGDVESIGTVTARPATSRAGHGYRSGSACHVEALPGGAGGSAPARLGNLDGSGKPAPAHVEALPGLGSLGLGNVEALDWLPLGLGNVEALDWLPLGLGLSRAPRDSSMARRVTAWPAL